MAHSSNAIRRREHDGPHPLPVVQRLRGIRRVLELTQKDVGQRMGTPQSVISGWESGSRVPNLSSFLAWCEALDLHVLVISDTTLDTIVNNYRKAHNDG